MAIPTATSTVSSFVGNKVPMTSTTFTPASSCLASSQFWELHSHTTSTWYLAGPRQIEDGCWPDLYTGAPQFYYSPAVDCPSGYTSACAQELISTNSRGQNAATETHVTCCPTVGDFSCRPGGAVAPNEALGTLGCISLFTEQFTQPVVQTPPSADGTGGTTTSTGTDIVIKPTDQGDDAKKTGTINAFSVEIAWQNSDSSLTGTRAAPTGPGNGGGSGSRAAGGLSRGAAIGIGVGVGVGVLLVLVAAALLWRRKRRLAKAADAEKSALAAGGAQEVDGASSGGAAGSPKAHIPGAPVEADGEGGKGFLPQHSGPSELSPDGQKPAEMMTPHSTGRTEMDGSAAPSELPSGDHRHYQSSAPVEMMGDIPQNAATTTTTENASGRPSP